MDPFFEELYGVDSAQAFAFFFEGLKDEVDNNKYRSDEMQYVASVLAHYAQVPRTGSGSIPAPCDPVEIFDNFILRNHCADPAILEVRGSQVILFAGFFRDQIARRHNVRFFDRIGQSFYERAGERAIEKRKRELFCHLSESLPMWTIACCNMSRTFRHNRFLLRVN